MKEARKLDVLLQSASGLKKVSTSKAYAVAWIDPSVRVPSPAERNHGASPVWNTTMSVSLDERALGQGMSLTIELIGQGLVKTKRIGFVTVDISDIVLEGSKGASVHGQFHAYPVTRRSGRQQGTLNFELHLHESPALLAANGLTPSESTVASLKYEGSYISSQKSSPPSEQQQSDPDSKETKNSTDKIHKGPKKRVYGVRPKSFLSPCTCY